jgi:hypothetical protein
MKRGYFYSLIFVTSTILVITLIVQEGRAMPGFARKYRFTCQTCHSPFPKLKPYGEEFAANGFKLPEGEPPRSQIDTGDDMLLLVRDFPIGVRIDVYGTYDPDEEETKSDLKTPYILKLISGGPITESISYYFYFFFSERGEVAGIEDAFLYMADLFGTGFSLTAGQFSVADPLYKAELRLTVENYEVFKFKPARSFANLKYDRGIILEYGFGFGLDLLAQVINGNAIDPADEETKSFDNDDFKNVMFRASQDFKVIRIGGFGYWGREKNTPDDLSTDYATNQLTYYGGDASLLLGPIEINFLYLYRKDSNGYFTEIEQEVKSKAYMVEAHIFPDGDRSRWILTALYNDFDSDFIDSQEVEILDYRSGTLSLTILLARNARLTTEYTYIFKNFSRGEDFKDYQKYTLGLMAAF